MSPSSTPSDPTSVPTPADEHRAAADHFVTWLPAPLAPTVTLPAGPSTADDPVAAWTHHADALQALLDDPASAELVLSNPHIGDVPVPEAVDRFCTNDVVFHAWDLARASRQEPGLDETRCAEVLAGMEPMEEMLRASGQFGPRQPVAADAPASDRLMAFLARDPDRRP
ncbi:TIGR03086 family protein [Nocardioides zeae]|uniref:TIGR03086 family protein n=1 Tax=Nocardioides zeae TaxID=1457234 RepID=A0A6P0HDQ0_9ACTN|nr:TIGR03086 family protein [Nocardioides zeae]NEN76811.1 TIGR03086 family protein [Nocardioides zeae]